MCWVDRLDNWQCIVADICLCVCDAAVSEVSLQLQWCSVESMHLEVISIPFFLTARPASTHTRPWVLLAFQMFWSHCSALALSDFQSIVLYLMELCCYCRNARMPYVVCHLAFVFLYVSWISQKVIHRLLWSLGSALNLWSSKQLDFDVAFFLSSRDESKYSSYVNRF